MVPPIQLGLGVGLPTAPSGGLDPYPGFTLSSLAIAGDSITAQNTTLPVGVHSNGYWATGYAVQGLQRGGHPFGLVRKVSTAHPDGLDWDFGYGSYSAADFRNGNRGGDGVYPMADIVAADPEAVFIFLGSNASEAASTDIFAIWDAFLAAGRKVFAAEVLPRHSTAAGFDATKLAETYALNAALQAGASARGIPFLEWASMVTDTPGGYGSLTYFPDAVHPGVQGAEVLGKAFIAFLAPWLGDPFAVPADGSASWVTENPYVSGDVSGGATGWTFPAAVTAKSKTTDGDGTVWQRVTLTSASNAVIRQTAGTTTAVAGDVVRPVLRVRGVESGWDIRGINVRMYHGGTGAGFKSHANYVTAATELIEVPDGWLLIGPEYLLPDGFSNLFTYIYCSGSGTFDFRQAGVIKIT